MTDKFVSSSVEELQWNENFGVWHFYSKKTSSLGYGAITLLLQQVTINGWKWLPGPGFWNPSQKKIPKIPTQVWPVNMQMFS